MKIDLTLKITPKMVKDAQGNEKKTLVGHIGTYFDVMDKEFPLEYTSRKGIVFDCSKVKDREIEIKDIDINKINKDMFVGFYTGFINEVEYGSKEYFLNYPELSKKLLDLLIKKEVSIVGIDFAGVRRGKEHTLTDQYFANNGAFIVENLCNLDKVINKENLIINTYPMSYEGVTGLPCRVVAEVS